MLNLYYTYTILYTNTGLIVCVLPSVYNTMHAMHAADLKPSSLIVLRRFKISRVMFQIYIDNSSTLFTVLTQINSGKLSYCSEHRCTQYVQNKHSRNWVVFCMDLQFLYDKRYNYTIIVFTKTRKLHCCLSSLTLFMLILE